jgi:hypothetical protein
MSPFSPGVLSQLRRDGLLKPRAVPSWVAHTLQRPDAPTRARRTSSSLARAGWFGHDRIVGNRIPARRLTSYHTFGLGAERDHETLVRFHEFREETERKGFRYFLEVFDPNVPGAVAPEVLPKYINDTITRMLAGVAPTGRPLFRRKLKFRASSS